MKELNSKLIIAHNKIRKANKRPILILDNRLQKICEEHALYMAQNNRMTHYNDGNPFTRMIDAGYRYGYAGENIAFGQKTVEEVMRSWMLSMGHRMNILLKSYKNIGAASSLNANGELYWCVDFGSLLSGKAKIELKVIPTISSVRARVK